MRMFGMKIKESSKEEKEFNEILAKKTSELEDFIDSSKGNDIAELKNKTNDLNCFIRSSDHGNGIRLRYIIQYEQPEYTGIQTRLFADIKVDGLSGVFGKITMYTEDQKQRILDSEEGTLFVRGTLLCQPEQRERIQKMIDAENN